MSVRKCDRQKNPLEVLTLARNLAIHTIRLCKNDKLFPKAQRWILTQRIAHEAIESMTCIRRANATLLAAGPTIEVDYAYRRAQQVEAHAHIGALLSLIDVAYELNDIDGDRIHYWVGLAKDTDDKLKSWMRSDKLRYLGLAGQPGV